MFDFYAKKTRNTVIVSVGFFIPAMLGQSHNPENGSILFKAVLILINNKCSGIIYSIN